MTSSAERALLRPSLYVALGVLVSAWPLGRLFLEAPWRGPLLGTVILLALVGALTRLAGRALAPLAQVVALVGVLTLLFGEGTGLFGIVPTPATLEVAADLTAESVSTITSSPAPAPAGPGVSFVFTAGFGALALVADAVGVTLRRPLLAAVPLLIPFLAAVANIGEALPWYHLGALAAVIAVLLYDGHRRSLRTWAREDSEEESSARPLTATLMVVAALALAMLTTAMLPHLPTRYLADGFGRSGGLGQVGFSPSPDLITDLRDDDATPVLTYRTDDPSPAPIRVAVASTFTDDGWQARSPVAEPSDSPVFSPPPGLSGDVETEQRQIEVERTRLEAPYLASPGPVVSGSVSGARWNQDRATQMLVVDRRPSEYTMTYLSIAERAGGEELPPIRRLVRSGVVSSEDLDTSGSTDLLRSTLQDVTAAATTPAERADAIQGWLRTDPSFTYSLELPQSDGRGPVDAFLTHRTGYCVQFATTMILMAREEGIPARMATGFLAGSTEGDERVVRANDAHAWPELYLDELGWVRYEPTPSARTGAGAPAYGPVSDVPTETDPEAAADPTATPTPTQDAADPNRPEVDTDPGAPADLGAGEDTTATDPSWWLVVPALLLLLLLLAVSPLSSLWMHRRRLAQAESEAARVDEHWRWLGTRLSDLGVQAPAAATVRARGAAYRQALQEHVEHDGGGDGPRQHLAPGATAAGNAPDDVDTALTRLVTTVESARYGAPGARPGVEHAQECRRDVRTVAGAAWRRADHRRKVRAVLSPSDGVVSRLRDRQTDRQRSSPTI